TPPQPASARATPQSWKAYPTSPQGKPPNGTRPRPASTSTQTAASTGAAVIPRRPSQPATAPASIHHVDRNSTNGTTATAPKYRVHSTSTAKKAAPAAPPYSAPARGPVSRQAHSSGASATRASGPRSSGGKADASSRPDSTAAPSRTRRGGPLLTAEASVPGAPTRSRSRASVRRRPAGSGASPGSRSGRRTRRAVWAGSANRDRPDRRPRRRRLLR